MGKVDLMKNACVVSSKTDEVLVDGTTSITALARGATSGEDLIRHGYAVPPSPPGEGSGERNNSTAKRPITRKVNGHLLENTSSALISKND